MPAIRHHIFPERRDFVHDVVVVEHSDRSELDTHRDSTLEEVPHVGRLGRGGEIPVEMRVTKKGVAHGPSDAPRLEARVLQTLCHTADGLGWIELGRGVIGFWCGHLPGACLSTSTARRTR